MCYTKLKIMTKKDNNKMKSEKVVADLFKELSKQNFESKSDLNEFMQNIMTSELSQKTSKKSISDKSQDLVYEAYESSVTKGKKLIKKALELDPNNTDAYNYLAETEKEIDKAIEFYEKAIKSAQKVLGKKAFIEDKGHFWGIFATRPFMRAKSGLADCFYAIGKVEKAIDIYKEMLELNPRDNQGIRFSLSTLHIELGNFKEFDDLNKLFGEDISAVSKFNKALCQFKKEGKNKKSDKLLLEAHKQNSYVIDYLLGNKKMPKNQPQYIGIGDENEAIAYVNGNWKIWDKTEDSLEWIYNFKKERINLN